MPLPNNQIVPLEHFNRVFLGALLINHMEESIIKTNAITTLKPHVQLLILNAVVRKTAEKFKGFKNFEQLIESIDGLKLFKSFYVN